MTPKQMLQLGLYHIQEAIVLPTVISLIAIMLKGGGLVHSEIEANGEDISRYTIHIGERHPGKFGGFRLAMSWDTVINNLNQ